MKALHKYLLGFFILQLVLSIGLYWSHRQGIASSEPGPLLSVQLDTVNKLVISGEGQSTTLVRNGNGWQLENLNNLPVSESRLSSLLDRLADVEVTWPVSQTSGSHERFEVAEDTYRKRIEFFVGDALIETLFIGSSPSFRKSHLRLLDDNSVFLVAVNDFEFPATADQWLNNSLLAINAISSMKYDGFEVVKVDNVWSLVSDNLVSAIPDIDTTKVQAIESAINGLVVNRVLSDDGSLSGLDKITVVVGGETEQFTYAFYQKGEEYYLQRNDYDVTFVINKNSYEQLATVTLDKILLEQGAVTDAEPSDGGQEIIRPVPPADGS